MEQEECWLWSGQVRARQAATVRDCFPLPPLPPSTPFNFNHDGLLLHAVIRPIVLQLSSPLSSLGTWDLIFANEVVRNSCYTSMDDG